MELSYREQQHIGRGRLTSLLKVDLSQIPKLRKQKDGDWSFVLPPCPPKPHSCRIDPFQETSWVPVLWWPGRQSQMILYHRRDYQAISATSLITRRMGFDSNFSTVSIYLETRKLGRWYWWLQVTAFQFWSKKSERIWKQVTSQKISHKQGKEMGEQYTLFGASLMAPLVKNPPARRKPWFHS